MRALRPHVRVALAVPGQGSQAVGMGKTLHAEYPAARAVFDRVEATLKIPLKKAMFEGPKEQLTRTSFAQPAILTHSVAAFEAYKVLASPSSTAYVLQAELKEPKVQNIAKVALGHSVGEIAALCIAGAIELEDAARLLVRIPSPSRAHAPSTCAARRCRRPCPQAAQWRHSCRWTRPPQRRSAPRQRRRLARSSTLQVLTHSCLTLWYSRNALDVNSSEQVVISGDAAAVNRYCVETHRCRNSLTQTQRRRAEQEARRAARYPP